MEQTELLDRQLADAPNGPNDSVQPPQGRRVVLGAGICSAGVGLGIGGGLTALVSGLVCVVAESVTPGDTAYGRLATILLIIAIPLLLIGSIFIDELALAESRKRN
jgi:hypothetical protein